MTKTWCLRILGTAALAGLSLGVAVSQTGNSLRFEAASIRPNNGPAMGQGAEALSMADGRLRITNIPLRMLIRVAFLGLRDNRPIIGPDVLDRVRVDLVAKSESPNASVDDMRIMVQNLLNDRMKLVSHFQTQEMPAYALMVAGSTVKLVESAAESGGCESRRSTTQPLPLTPSRPAEGSVTGAFNHIECRNVSMTQFANQLTTMLDRPVVDQTSLGGNRSFAFDYEIQRDEPLVGFSGLRGLGLQLIPGKLPVPVLVVDSIASAPTDE